MTQEALVNPKVFISYSWSSDDYQQWVIDLAKRLVHDGVNVVIDVWDLVEGQDKYVFMEQMVKSVDINRVLVMCDEKYKVRADERKGGVGDETQIISSDVYDDVKQEKFIPIVSERNDQGEAFIPNYIKSRIYIDLSNDDIFEKEYEKLLRNIYKVPLHQKPKLGNAPSFLFEKKEIDHFKTTVLLKRMESLKDKNPSRLKSISIDFSDELIRALDQFTIEKIDDKPLDDTIVEMIQSMQPLQNDYVSIIKIQCETETIDSDYIIEFFERLYGYSEFRGNGVYNKQQMDHYKFFIQQLYILTIAILLKYKNYKILAEVVNADYFVDSQFSRHKPQTFNDFRFYLESLYNRNIRLKLNRISLHADQMIKMAEKDKNQFIEADLLLYYIAQFNKTENYKWFPHSYIYFKEYYRFRFISRLSSKRHFEEVKTIFNVASSEEFIKKASEMEYERGYSSSFYPIPTIESFIELDRIATKP